jgi:hypothetical protein
MLDPSDDRRDEVGFNELNINLKISYRTILLIFVVFNVADRFVSAFV